MLRVIHFVGFKNDRYWNAVKVWGFPAYLHPGWDLRAFREIAPDDLIIFAEGDWTQEPRVKSYSDMQNDPT